MKGRERDKKEGHGESKEGKKQMRKREKLYTSMLCERKNKRKAEQKDEWKKTHQCANDKGEMNDKDSFFL